MPFKSAAQRRKFAQMLNEKKITKKVFDEWDHETPSKLPERLGVKAPRSTNDLRKIGELKAIKVIK